MLARIFRSKEPGVFADARAIARQVIVAQCWLAVIVAVLWLPAGFSSAGSAFAGVSIAAIGTALFAFKQFAGKLVSVPQMTMRFYAAGVWKWLWTLASLYVLFAWVKAPALPLLTGLIVGQFASWSVFFRSSSR